MGSISSGSSRTMAGIVIASPRPGHRRGEVGEHQPVVDDLSSVRIRHERGHRVGAPPRRPRREDTVFADNFAMREEPGGASSAVPVDRANDASAQMRRLTRPPSRSAITRSDLAPLCRRAQVAVDGRASRDSVVHVLVDAGAASDAAWNPSVDGTGTGQPGDIRGSPVHRHVAGPASGLCNRTRRDRACPHRP